MEALGIIFFYLISALVSLFILYLIIINAIKQGIKEVYKDLKNDIAKDFNLEIKANETTESENKGEDWIYE